MVRQQATKSLREVTYVKPLRECGLEELSVHQWTANPSGGVMFARKKDHDEKDYARGLITLMFGREQFQAGLTILSMPGLNWRFEKSLLRMREGKWETELRPQRTYLTCIENDRSIYHSALMQMPGMHTPHAVTKVLPATSFAERVVRNRWIGRFFFGNVDDLMQKEGPFDAAWLDYTGPLSVKRLRIIEDFYARSIRHILVVTALKARWNRDTSDAIDAAGGHSAWLRAVLPGDVMHDIEYQDGPSPMAQIAVRTHRSLQKRCFC